MRLPFVPVVVALTWLFAPAVAAAQAPPAAPASPRPNVAERPWTTAPGSPYDRAQAVAAERARAEPAARFPAIEAPPPEGTGPAGALFGAPQPVRPSVLDRAWTAGDTPPYDRAQAVAIERLRPEARLHGSSPYPDEYRSPVPAPFRPAAADRAWWGAVLYPGLPFPAIRW